MTDIGTEITSMVCCSLPHSGLYVSVLICTWCLFHVCILCKCLDLHMVSVPCCSSCGLVTVVTAAVDVVNILMNKTIILCIQNVFACQRD